MVDHRLFALGRLAFEALKLAAEHQCPRAVLQLAGIERFTLAQRGGTVGDTVHLVQLMGELVQDDIVPVEGVFAAAPAGVPREHDRAVLP